MARQRGHVEDKGGGTYRLVVENTPDPMSGRRRQVTRTVHIDGPRPAQQAQQALTRLLAEVDAGSHNKATADRTLTDLYLAWLDHAAAGMEPNTADEFRGVHRRYLADTIGRAPLAKVRPYDLDMLYGHLLASGARGGKPLSAATVRKVHTALRLALAQGVNWKWLSENPALHASPPKVAKPEPTPPDHLEARALIEAADEHDQTWACYLRLAAAVGARRGEMCALRWSAVDLDEATLSVRAAVIVTDNGPQLREYPKTAAGRRRVGLDDRTVAILRGHRKRQAEHALSVGAGLVADPFLFSAEHNGARPWHPVVVTHRFARLRKRVGLEHVRLHDVRHYVASQLLAAGVDPVTVAGRLGHANPHVTMSTYAHWIPARDKAAADVMGALLDG